MAEKTNKRERGARRRSLRRTLRAVATRIASRDNAPKAVDAEVRFVDADGQEIACVQSGAGSTILAIAAKAGVEIDHFCGGQCSCGTCRINVVNGAESLSKMSGMEQMVLGDKHLRSGCRLSCQAMVNGRVTVQVPRWF